MGKYEDKEWLYDQYITQRKSQREIAEEQGVTKGVIGHRLNKFKIKKPKEFVKYKKPIEYVDVKCEACGEITVKTRAYIKRKNSEGSNKFYCDTTCFGIYHSEAMKGKDNPNYGNKSGITPNDYRTKEQMSRHAKDAWDRHREDGTYEVRLKKMREGMYKFYATEEGKELRKKQGYLSLKSQRRKESSIEKKMRKELSKRGIEFEQEKPFIQRYIIDFYLPEYRIAIECDGDYWHRLPNVVEKDMRRDEVLKENEVKVFRFWESEINKSVEACVDIVMAEINALETIA